jgi:hypothetical protein
MQIDKSEYGSYYGRYIELVNGIPLENLWKSGAKDVITLIDSLTDDEALIRYEEDKWSLKEVIGHVLDTERIFC